MRSILSFTALALISMFMVSCETEEEVVVLDSYPLKELSLYPEGIAYSELFQKTYVGSYFKGKIVTVDLAGNMADFVTDESLVAVVGLAVDEQNNRLLVCNSDAGISMRSSGATTGQLAEVIAYDLVTGAKLQTVDLSGLFPGGHFLNDLVLNSNGNIYITVWGDKRKG